MHAEDLGTAAEARLALAKRNAAKEAVVRALYRLEIANARRELPSATVRRDVEEKLAKLERAEEEVRRLAARGRSA